MRAVPRALAVLNPNQPGCPYPCKISVWRGRGFQAGAGAAGRQKRNGGSRRAPARVRGFCPLSENRGHCDHRRLGAAAGRKPGDGGAGTARAAPACGRGVCARTLPRPRAIPRSTAPGFEVAFRIAPRINAAGRMDVAKEVVELFTDARRARARELAAKLEQLNPSPRRGGAALASPKRAWRRMRGSPPSRLLVVEGDGWHRGVIGIWPRAWWSAPRNRPSWSALRTVPAAEWPTARAALSTDSRCSPPSKPAPTSSPATAATLLP